MGAGVDFKLLDTSTSNVLPSPKVVDKGGLSATCPEAFITPMLVPRVLINVTTGLPLLI